MENLNYIIQPHPATDSFNSSRYIWSGVITWWLALLETLQFLEPLLAQYIRVADYIWNHYQMWLRKLNDCYMYMHAIMQNIFSTTFNKVTLLPPHFSFTNTTYRIPLECINLAAGKQLDPYPETLARILSCPNGAQSNWMLWEYHKKPQEKESGSVEIKHFVFNIIQTRA